MIQNRFRKILIPLDGSANSIRGLNEAISLARQCNSKILAVHVIPIFPQRLLNIYSAYATYLRKVGQEILEKARTNAARHGIDLSTKILYGNQTAKIILNYTYDVNAELIVIGSRGLTFPKEKHLGSVSSYLVNFSKVPILVVK